MTAIDDMPDLWVTTCVAERWRAKVAFAAPDECWRWTAAMTPGGYGKMKVGRELVGAHRLSYQLHVGPIPDDTDVCHACDNRWCVNPAHLWLGTAKDNALDMFAKGRGNPYRSREKREQTHCHLGHEFTPENTYRTTGGTRSCRTCVRLRGFRRYWRPAPTDYSLLLFEEYAEMSITHRDPHDADVAYVLNAVHHDAELAVLAGGRRDLSSQWVAS